MSLSRPASFFAAVALCLSGCGGPTEEATDGARADSSDELVTVVPGQDRPAADKDGNGYPDSGVIVTGVYESLYAEDAQGHWWWDLGDGRIEGSVASLDALDAATTTRCEYRISYRGDFGNTASLDSGWINNSVRCHGYTRSTSHYLIVHRTDPRYRGNPEWAVWGDWEYHVLTESKAGNLVRPFRPTVAPRR